MTLREKFQQKLFKLTMKLPDATLRRMSGGHAIEIAGEVLDARLQFIAHKSKSRVSLADLPIDTARRAFDTSVTLLDPPPASGLTVQDMSFVAEAGHTIPVRTYRPPQQAADQPLLVWFHGGGGVLGNLETSHSFLTHLSKAAGIAVISVDYRLAPEHPFPSGVEDALEAYKWALGQAERLGAPKGRAAVGGDSMGGKFAAVVAQETLRMGLPKAEYQLLVYPALDWTADTKSRKLHAESYPLTEKTMTWFAKLYAQDADEADARLVPGRDPDLSDLPPAFIYTAGYDVLCDEAVDFAARLDAQGVRCVSRHYSSLCHGFISMAGICPAAAAANADMACDIKGFAGA